MPKTLENNLQSSLELSGRRAAWGQFADGMGLIGTECVSSPNRQASRTSAEAKPYQLVSPRKPDDTNLSYPDRSTLVLAQTPLPLPASEPELVPPLIIYHLKGDPRPSTAKYGTSEMRAFPTIEPTGAKDQVVRT